MINELQQSRYQKDGKHHRIKLRELTNEGGIKT